MAEPEAAKHPPLSEDATADVLVVGGGITGLTAALRLAEADQRVIVVEARTLCSGVTGYTTAHCTEAVDARYRHLASRFGDAGAEMVARSSRAALDHITARVRSHGIACDLERVPGYLYCEDPVHREDLAEEHKAARKAGLAVDLDVEVELPYIVAGTLRFPDQLRFHPRKYVLGLAAAARQAGVRIYEHSRVTGVQDGEPVVATIEERYHVRARAAVLATHVPLNRVFLQGRLRHMQSYAVAFADRSIEDALFWDSSDPYHYLRRANIDGQPYLIVGGEDHPVGTEDHTEIAFERLLAYCRARLGTDRPTYHWSAEVHESVDGLPLIGANAASRHVYVATGFAGNGMTFGTLGGLLIGDLILGIDNPWAALYSPARLSPTVLGKSLANLGEMQGHLIGDRMHAPEVGSTHEIERDQGRTMKISGKRLAVYRDPGGALHALSGVCTHLGCLVKFNDAERTWDCPCHGSRFDVDGEVIEGPALAALARYDLADEPAAAPKSKTKTRGKGKPAPRPIAPPASHPVGQPSDDSPAHAPDPNPGLDGFK